MKNIKDDELISLYKKIDFIFKNKNISSIREHLDIIFVFGRAPFHSNSSQQKISWNEKIKNIFCNYKPNKNSIRTNFMNFVARHNSTQFKFVTIETLYKDLSDHASSKGVRSNKIQLAKLELNAIRNAYSVLIFPESPGSFAELGYFAAKEETRNRIIVSSHIDFINDKSYIKSLIEIIHEDKDIDPIYLKNDNDTNGFELYLSRLNERYTDYNHEVYTSEDIKEHYMFPLAVIYETIKYFPNLEFSELRVLIRYIFDDLKLEINHLDNYLSAMISLLYVAGLIERKIYGNKKFFIIVNNSFRCIIYHEFSEKEYRKILETELSIKSTKEIDDI